MLKRAANSRAVVCTGLPCSLTRAACAVCALLLLVLGGPAVQAQTDVLTLRNGDRLTGEIESLDRGRLLFDTDATDTIEFNWEHVAKLTSAQYFEVVLDTGDQYFGTLSDGADASILRLTTASAPVQLPMASVVRMTPIESRVIERIEMNVDIGYSLTKANKATQTNLGYDFAYRDQQRRISLNSDSSLSESDNNEPSKRINTTFAYRRFLPGRQWDPVGLGQIERNDELGIDRRVTLGGGMTRWITDTNDSRTSFVGGLVYTTEDAQDSTSSDESAEAVLGLTAEWFRYDTPELDVSTRLTVYERITGASRTRGNLDVDFRWDLFADSVWGFSIYYSFDTQPENETASKADYGVMMTLGWDF